MCDMEKILIIIPAYNEEGNIKSVYEKCKTVGIYDILVINDGSNDNTLKILQENKIPHVNLIKNLGIGGAVQTGYKYAYSNNYDYAIQFDGDGQHNIEYVKNMITSMKEGNFDFVIGSRFIENDLEGFKSSFSRRIGIKVISKLIKICTGKIICDPTSGFRCANKKVIETFANTYPTEYPEPDSTVFLLKKGYFVKEIPVIMNERVEGQSSISSWKNIYYMMNVCLSILLTSRSLKGGK